GLEIPVIDADKSRARLERCFQLLCRVHFDQSVEAKLLGLGAEFLQLLPLEQGYDQKNRVGSEAARLDQVIAVEREILAQQRKRSRVLDRRKVVEAALKIFLLGQDGKRARAAGREVARDLDGLEIAADQSLRRRGALHLRDNAPRPARHRGGEAARRAGEPRPVL